VIVNDIDMGSSIDELDKKILRELTKDSTLSTRALGGILGESSSTLYNRIRRLIDRGVIQSFTVLVNHELVGMEVSAYCMVSAQESEENSLKQIAGNISKINGVKNVTIVLGSDYEIIVLIRGESVKTVGSTIMDNIRLVKGVVNTKVSIVKEEILREVEKSEEFLSEELIGE